MNRVYDRFTNTVTITATPEELYEDIHTRGLIPDARRAEIDEERAFLLMTPEQREEAYRNKNTFFTDEEAALLGR